MIVAKAFAKINWLLDIGSLQPDGYHDLFTIFQTIDLFDDIYFKNSDSLTLSVVGQDQKPLDIGSLESNLVYKAALQLKAHLESRYRDSRKESGSLGAEIVLRKRIPVAAGLGGGSSDAAATLIALNKLWDGSLTPAELATLGAELGSDVPFFIYGGTAFGKGRGIEIEKTRDVEAPYLLLVNPRVEVSTVRAYQAFDQLTRNGLLNILPSCSFTNDDQLFSQVRNSFSTVVKNLHPEIGEVEQVLTEVGGDPVLMSGSGATVWAKFNSAQQLSEAAQAVQNYSTNRLSKKAEDDRVDRESKGDKKNRNEKEDAQWLIIKTRAIGRDEYFNSMLTELKS
ncbi:MAG: 4-(cytidine 5'-diphospho)-2-C-methyl-D-erythritol kinase [Blastocatellia bacterium]|nr:4-(cytidine 5'-diphospho)-2-C-methyl-D-erythritol kinase [Blastocatellia bacterium]